MYVSTFLLPSLISDTEDLKGSVAVVIDVLRASTTICAALYNGAAAIECTTATDDALQRNASASPAETVLGGERNGVKPIGFDLGNSPFEYTAPAVEGKTVIFTTTNGTRAVEAARSADETFIGGFVNLSVMCSLITTVYLASERRKNVALICAGTDGNISFEDTVCAGAFATRLGNLFPQLELTSSARIAKLAYEQCATSLAEQVSATEHAQRLAALGFDKDVERALTMDAIPVAPALREGLFKNAGSIRDLSTEVSAYAIQ